MALDVGLEGSSFLAKWPLRIKLISLYVASDQLCLAFKNAFTSSSN